MSQMRAEEGEVGVMTGHVGITSGSLVKPGEYPSKLNWSLLGESIGFIYVQGVCTDQAMLQVVTNSERGAGSRGNSDEWRNKSLLGHKAEMN